MREAHLLLLNVQHGGEPGRLPGAVHDLRIASRDKGIETLGPAYAHHCDTAVFACGIRALNTAKVFGTYDMQACEDAMAHCGRGVHARGQAWRRSHQPC